MSAGTTATGWRRRMGRLFQGPRPHGAVDPERVVGPLELFYDLVVVVLVAQAGHHLAEHLTWEGVGDFAAVFAVIWIAWLNGTMMHDLHGRDDVGSRNRVFAQMLVLTVMATQVADAPGETGTGFALSAAALFALMSVLWWWVARQDDPSWRPVTRPYIVGTAAFAILLAATALLDDAQRVLAWGVMSAAYLALAVIVSGVTASGRSNPLTVTESLAERSGLLVIIVLGEVFLGVVEGLTSVEFGGLQLVTALAALAVGFGMWWTYFDLVGHRLPAARPGAAVSWLALHLPLTAAAAAAGASMVVLVEGAGEGRADAGAAWVLSGGAAVLLLSLIGCTLQREPGADVPGWPERIACLVAAALAVGLGAARPSGVVLCLGLVAILMIPWLVGVVRGTVMPDDASSAAAG